MTAVCTFAGGLFPSNSQCNATIFSDSSMPSTVIRLMTLAAIKASVFWGALTCPTNVSTSRVRMWLLTSV